MSVPASHMDYLGCFDLSITVVDRKFRVNPSDVSSTP